MTKILFITYDFPYPTNSGGKARAYNMMKFAIGKDLEIQLFSFIRPSFKKSYEDELEKIGVSKIYITPRKAAKDLVSWGKAILGNSSIFKLLYFDKKVEKKILDIIKSEKIDIVLFESFYTSFYISDKIKKLGIKQIFGTENIEHQLYHDFAKSKPGILKKPFMIQVGRIRAEEEKAYKNSDIVLAVTADEKKYISDQTSSRIEIIPNGIDSNYLKFKPRKVISNNLLFVGNFSYFPNVEAMEFLYKEVLLGMPSVNLAIVGKNQEKLSFYKKSSRIAHVEYVEDLRDAYYNADVFVFPVRYGGGTNFKVLEAAACGTPIVALPDRVRGLGFVADNHYIAAKTPEEFKGGIEELLKDEKVREKISNNARELVEKEYDWKGVGEKLRKILTIDF